MKRPSLGLFVALWLGLASPDVTRAQDLATSKPARPKGWMTKLDKIYRDESHCLVAPEIRSEKDNPISFYCRDAVTDARYVYQTYLLTEKDPNLNGTFLALQRRAQQECGDPYIERYDVINATEETGDLGAWNGPEVTRKYPPDSSIEQIKSDANGFRTVKYEVRLTYHDPQGRSTKVENFSAAEKLGSDFKKYACPPGAVCPK